MRRRAPYQLLYRLAVKYRVRLRRLYVIWERRYDTPVGTIGDYNFVRRPMRVRPLP